jgi:hypothetical protein
LKMTMKATKYQNQLINACIRLQYASKMKKGLKKSVAKYPVPEWMDESLKPIAGKRDVFDRHELADSMERKAAQLRGFKRPEVRTVDSVQVNLRQNEKDAVIKFAEVHGGKIDDERENLSLGIRWVLAAALSDLSLMSKMTSHRVKYRNAEDLCDSDHTENLIKNSLEKWKNELATKSDGETDD